MDGRSDSNLREIFYGYKQDKTNKLTSNKKDAFDSMLIHDDESYIVGNFLSSTVC